MPIECNYADSLDDHRTCTDVLCIIVGVVFSLVMIILGITLFNYGTHSLTQTTTSSRTSPLTPMESCVEWMLQAMIMFILPIPPPSYSSPKFRIEGFAFNLVQPTLILNYHATWLRTSGVNIVALLGSKFKNMTILVWIKVLFVSNLDRGGRFCIPSDESLSAQLISNAHL